MKKSTYNRKLRLVKKTIANLDTISMLNLHGGGGISGLCDSKVPCTDTTGTSVFRSVCAACGKTEETNTTSRP